MFVILILLIKIFHGPDENRNKRFVISVSLPICRLNMVYVPNTLVKCVFDFMLLQILKMFHDPVRKPERYDVLGYLHTIFFRNLRLRWLFLIYDFFVKFLLLADYLNL